MNLDQAAEKLADALAELTWAKEAAEPRDPENRRLILHDLNHLLAAAGPGAEVRPSLLSRPTQLQSHLRSALEVPAQVLARELPGRLGQWLKEEPKREHPDRGAWAAQGRWLLDQARLSPSPMA